MTKFSNRNWQHTNGDSHNEKRMSARTFSIKGELISFCGLEKNCFISLTCIQKCIKFESSIRV